MSEMYVRIKKKTQATFGSGSSVLQYIDMRWLFLPWAGPEERNEVAPEIETRCRVCPCVSQSLGGPYRSSCVLRSRDQSQARVFQ